MFKKVNYDIALDRALDNGQTKLELQWPSVALSGRSRFATSNSSIVNL